MLRWIILLLLFLGFGYWALQEKEEKLYKQDGVELPWKIEELKKVYRITFQQNDKSIMVIRHETGYWWLAQPERGMANQYRISVWLNTLMMPKIMRWMEPTEMQRALLKNAISIELEYGKDKVHRVQYYEIENRKDSMFIYLPTQDKILVLESYERMGMNLKLTDYRTIRIFPFKPNATKSMTYRVHGKEYKIAKHEKGWEINFEMDKTWENLIKKMYNAASKGFVEGRLPGEILASWEFEYESGEKSKLELFLTEKGYAAYYRGRDIGQLIDQREVMEFFPEAIAVKN